MRIFHELELQSGIKDSGEKSAEEIPPGMIANFL